MANVSGQAAEDGLAARGAPELSPGGDALFLDYDGTLTEIVEIPGDAILSEPRRIILARVAARMSGAVAILSGRAVLDLTRQVSAELWRVGSHGVHAAAPGDPGDGPQDAPPPALLAAAEDAARAHQGVLVEMKPGGLALHYRQNPEAGPACDAAMEAAMKDAPGHILQYGKMVVEARPKGADKGHALRRLMETDPFRGRRPVMVGDDLTDEAAMRAALDLGGAAVKVGEGDSVAPRRLKNPAAVYEWLERTLEGT